MTKRDEAVNVACFLFILAVVFFAGFEAGRNSVLEYVRAIDHEVNRPSMRIP